MNVKLLVMDEGECAETDVVGLTGVMVPVEIAGTSSDLSRRWRHITCTRCPSFTGDPRSKTRLERPTNIASSRSSTLST